MSNASYKKGYRAEKKTRRLLEKQGWFCVESRGSHGIVDLCAFRGFDGGCALRLIQVKSGNAPMTPAERDKAKMLTRMLNHAIELWQWKDYAKKPEISLIQHEEEEDDG